MTFGQYMRPSKRHMPVSEYVTPEAFEKYRSLGVEMPWRATASANGFRSFPCSHVFLFLPWLQGPPLLAHSRLSTLEDGLSPRDGTQLQFKSVTQQMYLCAESGGGTIIVANRSSASGWETFKLWRITESTFQFRVFNGQFVGLSDQGNGVDVVAVSTSPGESETFQIVVNANDSSRVRIKSTNGWFLQAKSDVLVTADYRESTTWGDDDPSVFLMTKVGMLQGEFQVTNGYGTEAAAVMTEHWNTFITEDDFKFISGTELNAVRIPVGWWIASDPNPPSPFVGGSLGALDNAFTWADKYNLKVIIDLHAAPGSQNGYEHSASRDGSIEWGTTDSTIDQTVAVIEFLAARYAQRQSLLAVELLNEPRASGVPLDTLKNYYRAGYDAVRKHTTGAYVIMSNRLSGSNTELLQFASGLSRSVVDVHYYNLFSDIFNGMTVQQNIDYVNNNRSSELNTVITANGPLVFVGEWVAEWAVSGASKEDYQRFAQAQLDVYGRATFGWAYWTLKNVENHWSLRWMIDNGYISLFCNVKTLHTPPPPDPNEPSNVAEAISSWGLDYIVITSFDHDDLLDQGSDHFTETVQMMKAFKPKILIEALGDHSCVEKVAKSGLNVFAHVIETVESVRTWSAITMLTSNNRLMSLKWQKSMLHLGLLQRHQLCWAVAKPERVICTMEKVRAAGIDVMTFGQYMKPSKRHMPVSEYVTLVAFKKYRSLGVEMAKSDVLVTADYRESTTWGDDDPSVFLMTKVGMLQGEFQVTNGYGTEAAAVMTEHWNTFITEDDFKFISGAKLNAVRIPVGWWIASDPSPPSPFVGGSLLALNNAFTWADKYNLKVIIDLHAAPGSQNGYEHSASRDGSIEWGTTDSTIDQTVAVIEFLAARASKEDYQRFAQAQLDVYGRATFGWAYWTLNHYESHWSLKWMIDNGFISL
ncbi:Cellulase (glycosyl hydrolase family 5) [Musa troglodytarum]|uniref:Cellulase (Glycosyl hydrolase family 5) n=2 Tax=Musa troglodytarum TaxID=320322 RepID=A0A9E7EYD4_9LILI|nr:Cellulase (glycosyl hydrolase family 5) [Musa troglodytarum]